MSVEPEVPIVYPFTREWTETAPHQSEKPEVLAAMEQARASGKDPTVAGLEAVRRLNDLRNF